MTPAISTPRLDLISCTRALLRSIVAGREVLARELDVQIPGRWTEFPEAFSHVLDRISDHPEETGWWTYLPVHREHRILIGSCGYKGPPDIHGVVEIGYEVAPNYRLQGYATEIARGLIDHAFHNPAVRTVRAHTLSEENASTHILQKCGLHKIAELTLGTDSDVWRWERDLRI